MEEGAAGRDELGLQCATAGMWGCVSDAIGFVGCRRKWVAEAGGSVRGFNRKNKPLEKASPYVTADSQE